MLPRVILHSGISVDGRYDWFSGDVGLYYELAASFQAEAMLSGSNTILAAFSAEETTVEEAVEPSQPDPNDPRPWLVIVDSQGRVQNLHQIRRQPHWCDVIILCAHSTPESHLAYLRQQRIEHIITGEDRVDLRAALAELSARYGIKVIRVDSGGILNGVLLRAGLVDEVSVLINPYLVGGTTLRSIFVAPDLVSADAVIPLRLIHFKQVKKGTIWLRYEIDGD
jgi:2,5-diamino-6-(ribosylamino)-4(3H)-pyrimidinone 5'-phosphate reductase